MKPKAWSFTALTRFVNCPKQFYHINVIKDVADVEGEDAKWGNRVHLAFEKYLRDGKPLDTELVSYTPYLDAIKAVPGEMYVEHEMCLNNSLQPCGKWDPRVFVRGYADVLHVNGRKAKLIDHKTGKRKPGSKQMKLMALLTFAHFPEVEEIRVAFMWLKTQERDSEVFTKSQVMELWGEFLPDLKQYKEAFETETWQPRQSGLCHGWCPVMSCDFWKPKRPRKR